MAVKSDTNITLPLVEVDAMPKSVSQLLTERRIDASLPEVVKFKLFLDEAEPVCTEKPLPVGVKTV